MWIVRLALRRPYTFVVLRPDSPVIDSPPDSILDGQEVRIAPVKAAPKS